MTGPSVFGWRSPWSGDEADRVPRRYGLWFWLYRNSRIAKHWLGLHDWRESYPADRSDLVVGRRATCSWCGLVFGRPLRPYPFWVRHPFLWHAAFDGTRLCRCQRSREMRWHREVWGARDVA